MTRSNPMRLPAAVAGLAALTALAGCASSMQEARSDAATFAPASAPTEIQQWESRVQVEAAPDEILLAIHPTGLSQPQANALDALAARWVEAESREIVISAPLGSRDPRATDVMVAAVHARLSALGAPRAAVRVAGFDAAGDKSPVLRVGYLRHSVVTPRCGQWEDLTATRKNDAYENFGCAITANIAAQVANPHDLVGPRASTPIDAGRRDTVFDKYRKGEMTSSVREPQAAAAVSEVAK